MRHYKIAFVGLGSIGKRHLLNVCDYLKQCNDSYEVDLYRSGINKGFPEDIALAAITSANLIFSRTYDKTGLKRRGHATKHSIPFNSLRRLSSISVLSKTGFSMKNDFV